MLYEYIDIDKEEIPLSIQIDLNGKVYEFVFQYNNSFDFFTVDLIKDNVPLIKGEKLILNKPLFRNFVHINLPSVLLVPADVSGVAKRITFDNFNKTVFLYVVRDSS